MVESFKIKGFNSFLILSVFILSACNFFGFNNKDLIGKWVYLKYEYTNKSLDKPLADIATQKPYIVFHEDGKAEIFSSGKLISQGNYILEKKIIRYVETLPDGSERAIPFLIKELDNKTLVFETMDAEVKRITAKKQK